MPEITVLMPVRNGERYIKESIDSVLNQTLTDFEFLIIDDGSTDRTVEIIQGYTDKRIRLVRKEHQFIQNLNEGPGAELILIEKCLGREVPHGGLPADAGAIVMNVTSVSTLGAI